MKSFEYDILAVGGGTAGLVTAAGASYLGARVGLVEREALGGDCLWTGCVPSKALVASAHLAQAMRKAEDLGLRGASPAHASRKIMARMRRVRDVVGRHDDPRRFREMGVGVHFGRARFAGPETLEVEGVGRIRSRRIVLCTGAVPEVPTIEGLSEAGYLTHSTIFDQETLPESLLVIGAGPAGLELAQVCARLGARVTVVEALPVILSREDPDVSDLLLEILGNEGIRIRLRARVRSVRRDRGEKVLVLDDGEEIRGLEILVATGRRPRTADLELHRVGAEMAGPAVQVGKDLRTTARGVWAAGDVTGGLQFTHVADYMAKVAVQNALLPFRRKVDYENIPRVTYTDPEVAHVGLSLEEGEARGGASYSYRFRDLDRAIVEGDTQGFVRIVADRRGRILGATIVGRGAGDLILPLVLAKQNGLPLSKLANTVFPYPTRIEAVKRAADSYQRTRLQGPGGQLLKKVVSWLR